MRNDIYLKNMDKKRLRKFFSIDTKFTSRRTQNEQETGLGLIIIKELISKLGVEIKIQSIEVKDTTVSFTLKTTKTNDQTKYSNNWQCSDLYRGH